MKTHRTLYIKNMVCPRCIRVVKEDLEQLGIEVTAVDLGKAEIMYHVDEVEDSHIREVLENAGFEIMQDKEQKIIENIKLEILNLLNNPGSKKLSINNSRYLEERIGINYGYLSRLFSQQMGITIEKYLIRQKIEKVKELLKYEESTLEEIAYKLDYSSVAHLSKQFKDITGMTVTDFKKENVLKGST
jgi:AraC family transcriptional regulator